MRKSTFAPWALAACAAVVLSGAPSAWALSNAASTNLISSKLPAGVTLAKASIAQTAKALGSSTLEQPSSAATLTKVAVMAKTPKTGQGELSCENLYRLMRAAMDGAPQQSSNITQMALSLHPECADYINRVLDDRGGNGGIAPDGFNTPEDRYGGFGVGFGPGFPGSPGFTGSPPSGAIALPPGLVTSVVNG